MKSFLEINPLAQPVSRSTMAPVPDIERFSDKKYFFRVQKWGWKIVGFWPGKDNVSTLQIVLAVANSIEVLIYSVFQLMFCYANKDNLVLLLDAMTPVLTQITTAMKVLIIVWRRDDMRAVLDYLKQSFYFGKLQKHKLNLTITSFTTFIIRSSTWKHQDTHQSFSNFPSIRIHSLRFCKLNEFVLLPFANGERFLSTVDGD